MLYTILYILAAFIAGMGIAWFIGVRKLQKERRALKSASGFLESERLMKETLQKELAALHQHKMAAELELTNKLQAAENIIREMDSDILLMQKNYEETEALLKVTQPEVHALKLQLIEAQNSIARLKAMLADNESK
ncbi:MAG TPA: hypothetical protein PKC39_06780 [Ferruginibacter sp.]|nr:hypothetical protein [Ferruginibacter sp.]HMP20644.1 hypothetical protein [Ferruginibacter sp.]